MDSMPTPYRETPAPLPVVVERPICADCRHLRVLPNAPAGRSELWRCRASASRIEPATIDPLTGVRTPERAIMSRCEDVDGEGQCTKFEPMTLRLWLARHRAALSCAALVFAVLVALALG